MFQNLRPLEWDLRFKKVEKGTTEGFVEDERRDSFGAHSSKSERQGVLTQKPAD